MTDTLTIALAQLNPTVGSVSANLAKAKATVEALGTVDLVLFPELYISGYPPEDLVLRPSFIAACKEAVEELAAAFPNGPAMLMTLPWREGDKLHNAVAYLNGGKIETLRFKFDLPNYGVFDEKRVFQPGPAPGPINIRGVRIGVPICEDIWTSETCETLAETGAEILLSPNGSPFERNKDDVRLNLSVARVTETGLPLVYLNQVGGQDELVFDGASFVLNGDRSLALQMPMFEEAVAITHWHRSTHGWSMKKGEITRLPELEEETWKACVLGLRDYVNKNRFPGVVLGLSGGIDSAVVAAMAVDALGKDRVHCVMLPYAYTSKDSLVDAEQCAKLLGVRYDVVPIKEPVEGFLSTLQPVFAGKKADVAEENIQSRARGVILMAISNKFGAMVLTTGNKSEMSVGYATLYGDMNGGFNPIKDIYKIEVYRLAAWRNTQGFVIPERIITKAPTAELRENQKDQDSLPPYEVLDDILQGLVEKEQPIAEIVSRGHDLALVKRIQHLLYVAEYKRRQSAPGVKITRKNFGRDRRYPITNGFRDV
ncbi:NAD+ synthase [Aestuariivirga litoralis]|uniref:NAD+ synthase n=1 Tax=Aestuariivirga litoralis TaxID=2650924 RepID=UPI0018C7C9DD|nr:NAD+ synthase [Aestuariivirga litoralis]MBG1232186.1 NAD+ synthase [Aestuariivirga litoralis]